MSFKDQSFTTPSSCWTPIVATVKPGSLASWEHTCSVNERLGSGWMVNACVDAWVAAWMHGLYTTVTLHIGTQLSPPYSLTLATPVVAIVSLKWGSLQMQYWLPVPALGLQRCLTSAHTSMRIQCSPQLLYLKLSRPCPFHPLSWAFALHPYHLLI